MDHDTMTEPTTDASNDNSIGIIAPTSDATDEVVAELVLDKLIANLSVDVACRIHRLLKTGKYPASEVYLPQKRCELFPTLYANEDEVKEKLEKKRYPVYLPETRKRRKLTDPPLEHDYQKYVREAAAKTPEAATSSSSTTTVKPPPSDNIHVKTEDNAPEGKKESVHFTRSQGKQPNRYHGKQPPQPTAAVSAANALEGPVAQPAHNQQPPQNPVSVASSNSNVAASTPTKPATQQQEQQQQQKQHLDIWGRCLPKEPKEMIECPICGRQVNTLRFAPHMDKCMGIGTTVRAAAAAASGFVSQQQQQSSMMMHPQQQQHQYPGLSAASSSAMMNHPSSGGIARGPGTLK